MNARGRSWAAGERFAPSCLVLDFTGTLSAGGRLLPGVGPRLGRLAREVPIHVLTADTRQRARTALRGLPVELRMVRTGREKARVAKALGVAGGVSIGNGRNDIETFAVAALAIAIVWPEGACAGLLRAADIVCTDIRQALDLLLDPLRLHATLRR